MQNSPNDYSTYIHLNTLLSCQTPETSKEELITWEAERFFIICHQTSELWLSQVFADLELASIIAQSNSKSYTDICDLLTRAAGVMLTLCRTIELLGVSLGKKAFSNFRPKLDGISALESQQFQNLMLIINGSHKNLQSISVSLNVGENSSSAHDVLRIQKAVEILLKSCQLWRELHLKVVLSLIGSDRGTGGTEGAEFLKKQIDQDKVKIIDTWGKKNAFGSIGENSIDVLSHQLSTIINDKVS